MAVAVQVQLEARVAVAALAAALVEAQSIRPQKVLVSKGEQEGQETRRLPGVLLFTVAQEGHLPQVLVVPVPLEAAAFLEVLVEAQEVVKPQQMSMVPGGLAGMSTLQLLEVAVQRALLVEGLEVQELTEIAQREGLAAVAAAVMRAARQEQALLGALMAGVEEEVGQARQEELEGSAGLALATFGSGRILIRR